MSACCGVNRMKSLRTTLTLEGPGLSTEECGVDCSLSSAMQLSAATATTVELAA